MRQLKRTRLHIKYFGIINKKSENEKNKINNSFSISRDVRNIM